MTSVSPRRAWYVVLLLCVMAAISYLDRYIIALLAAPMIADLGIDVTQIGLLIGLGFGLLYSLVGLPMAHFIDRGRRVRIVGFGVILWSLSTIASALAPNFEILILTRAGVAIGEAVLVPATVSLIADLFAPNRRALPIGLFMAMSTLMGSGAFLIGGFVFSLATLLSPGVGLVPWRLTLVIAGLPGLILGPLWLVSVAEPERLEQDPHRDDITVRGAARYLRSHVGFYLPFLLPFGISALGSYSFIAWSATVLVRSYGQTVAAAGQIFGGVGLVAAAIAALFWPAINAAAVRAGKPERSLVALAIGLGIGHLAMAGFAVAGGMAEVTAVIALATFGFGAAGGLAVLIVQGVAPPRMRARITSLYMLLGNLVGLTCGPGLSAWLSEHVFEGPDALRHSLVMLASIVGPLTVLLLVFSRAGYGPAAGRAAA